MLPEDDKVIFDIVQTQVLVVRISRGLGFVDFRGFTVKEKQKMEKFNITVAFWVRAEVSEAREEMADVLSTDTV